MKQLAIVIPLLIISTGCSFETKGSMIPKYESPKTVLLVLDMQEDFLGDNAKCQLIRSKYLLLLQL